MSPRGSRAARPEQIHQRPVVLAETGLLVEHRDKCGRVRRYDFTKLPLAPDMQRSLAEMFAAKCAPGGGWDSTESSETSWGNLGMFARFLAARDDPPADISELTAAIWAQWRLSRSQKASGYALIAWAAGFLRNHPRLPAATREAMAKRTPAVKAKETAYQPEEFERIRMAARQMFRAAHMRITENIEHLRAWRSGEIGQGTDAWLVGEALDVLAVTGHVPQRQGSKGYMLVISRYVRVLGGESAVHTWRRLYLSRIEAAALGVLLATKFGLNATTVSKMATPRATPDSGEGGLPTYRVELEKRRRNGKDHFETRNVTDFGADSQGRLIIQALEATAAAREFVRATGSSLDRLLIWRETTLSKRSRR